MQGSWAVRSLGDLKNTLNKLFGDVPHQGMFNVSPWAFRSLAGWKTCNHVRTDRSENSCLCQLRWPLLSLGQLTQLKTSTCQWSTTAHFVVMCDNSLNCFAYNNDCGNKLSTSDVFVSYILRWKCESYKYFWNYWYLHIFVQSFTRSSSEVIVALEINLLNLSCSSLDCNDWTHASAEPSSCTSTSNGFWSQLKSPGAFDVYEVVWASNSVKMSLV